MEEEEVKPVVDVKSFIQFEDGTILRTLAVYSYKGYFEGAEREIFEIRLPEEEISFDEIRRIIETEHNTELLVLIERHYDEDGAIVKENKFQHGFYNLVIESGIKYIEDFGECFVLKLAQLTKEEQQEWLTNIDIDEQGAAIVELADIIAGM